MTRLITVLCAIMLSGLGFAPSFAQESPSATHTPPAQQNERLSPEQLDALTAPIALYPDSLVAQILTAATYPLEVVEAARWLNDPVHAALKGDALAAALDRQTWDVSVKSLVPFPELLRMMDANLGWTEQIGDAFLAQQADVMDSVQRLRKHALSAGNLHSTPEESVRTEGDNIIIDAVGADVIYVPYYNPWVIYGAWPWPYDPPMYFSPPPGIYLTGPAIVFGVGGPAIPPLWNWCYWDWSRRGLFITPHLPKPRTSPLSPRVWLHEPEHRRGVPYRDPTTAERFVVPAAGFRRDLRAAPSTSSAWPSTPTGPATRQAPPIGVPQQSQPPSPPAQQWPPRVPQRSPEPALPAPHVPQPVPHAIQPAPHAPQPVVPHAPPPAPAPPAPPHVPPATEHPVTAPRAPPPI